jgi:hypothetical protein
MKRVAISILITVLVLCCAAAAQSGTVSAKGSGVVQDNQCGLNSQNLFVCTTSAQGFQFSFAFTAPAETIPDQAVPATGMFSGVDRDNNNKYTFLSGTAFITPDFHFLSFNGVCSETTASGVTVQGTCESVTQQATVPGKANSFTFFFSGPAGFFDASGQPVNGTIKID